MGPKDFEVLDSDTIAKTILVNHWHQVVPDIDTIRYIFLSNESLRRTGSHLPRSRTQVLINPVADSFFDVIRSSIPGSIGRHSRDTLLKFPEDFFGVVEGISDIELEVMVLGSPESLMRLVQTNQNSLKHHYWMLPFGSMRVEHFLQWPEVYWYQTSNQFAETCPMNILEAMAAGIPVVAEAKGGISSLINDGETGILCTTQQEFQEAILRLLQDAGECTRIASNAKDWVRDHASIEHYSERFMKTVAELLGS